jgi:hypothetical protein
VSSPAGLKAAHAGNVAPIRVGVNCKAFYSPPCWRCRRILEDSDGNPRWDIIGGRFICPGGCTRPVRKAALS